MHLVWHSHWKVKCLKSNPNPARSICHVVNLSNVYNLWTEKQCYQRTKHYTLTLYISSLQYRSTNCTDSRPRARWYQLRGLPLVGSECVRPQWNSSLSHGGLSHSRLWTFPFVSQELTTNAINWSGTSWQKVSSFICTVKCPMIRPQRYSSLQKPFSGYQPQVGSDRVASVNIAAGTLGNHQVQSIFVRCSTT